MSTLIRDEIRQKLWRDYDPYQGFPYRTIKPDLQGWASHHRYLADTVASGRPKVIVEVGVWKGGSCLELAKAVQKNHLEAVVIAVDTWLGSWDHWIKSEWHGELGFEFGYPTMFRTFLANMVLGGVQDVVVPLPLDSANAFHTLNHFGIYPDLVHIDGAHDFEAVLGDLNRWWNILNAGGTIIMDDYFASVNVWPDVRRAVHVFIETVKHVRFEVEEPKCRFMKFET